MSDPLDFAALRTHWTAADPRGAGVGRILYRAVPDRQRPDWAASILLYVAGDDMCEELARLIEIAEDERRWEEAGTSFRALRQLTLANEQAGLGASRRQLVLDIGETAAKVIANTSRAHAFRHNAGWRMAPRLKRLVDHDGGEVFADNCWRLLTRSRDS